LNSNILSPEIQKFITANLHVDLHKFLLKKSPFSEVSSLELAQQILGRQIAQKKFPFLLAENIIFPPHLNLEQASSEAAARYKQSFISGRNGIDLTGGMGIDSFFLSQNAESYYFTEPNKQLLEIVRHNFSVLGRKNINILNQTAENFLEQNRQQFDFIFLDPSRRDKNQNKKFFLNDLSPNLLEIESRLHEISEQVFVKLSPLLDLQHLIRQIEISEIHIVSIRNEAKEIIVKLSKTTNENPVVQCVNLETSQPDFSFSWQDEKNVENPQYGEPQSFLFLPNSSVLKAGAFKLTAQKFGLKKLHPDTHIYTSDKAFKGFCGRIFEVSEENFNPKKSMQKNFSIISRNYPMKAEEIKKKYRLAESENQYLFFVKTLKGLRCISAKIVSDS